MGSLQLNREQESKLDICALYVPEVPENMRIKSMNILRAGWQETKQEL